jgi:hypothetical protein
LVQRIQYGFLLQAFIDGLYGVLEGLFINIVKFNVEVFYSLQAGFSISASQAAFSKSIEALIASFTIASCSG